MNKLFKKVHYTITNKKSQQLETDAAPSRPRTEEEIEAETVSSSEDEEEFFPKKEETHKSKKTESDENFIPDFTKTHSTTSSMGGAKFVQASHIQISHSSGIQIGNQYHFNIQKPTGPRGNVTTEEVPTQPSKPQPPPPNIEKTFSNRDVAQTTDFISIKSYIGSNWREVAEKLRLSDGVIQQVYESYRERGSSEVFYQLMLKWMESQPSTTTTVGVLCQALWNSTEMTAANILSKLHPPK